MNSFGLRGPALALFLAVMTIQILSTVFFIFKLLSEVFFWQAPLIPWELQETLEILCSVGLLAGVVSSVILLRLSFRRVNRIQSQLNATAGKFEDLVASQFTEWALTPTERHVALLVIKGFSNPEIAGLRGTSESTVKSQLTAIFRKSGLSSRQQLVSCVIEDILMALKVE